MSTTNTTFDPLEVEQLHPRPASARTVRSHFNHVAHSKCRAGCLLLKLFMEAYPLLSTMLCFVLLLGFVIAALEPMIQSSRNIRHELRHDYTSIDSHYNFKAAQIDHWCLFGGDEECSCEDFSEPIARQEMKGWIDAHETNKQLAKAAAQKDLDVVFLGDDMTEIWNGRLMNLEISINPNGREINQYFRKTFTKQDGGQLEGVALGISGDSSSNLLWRIQHGEVPEGLTSKVWWILIGTNDLARGECSEEATVLGILHVADEIHYRHPDDIVVIQGILPRSNRPDGSLSTRSAVHSLFRRTHTEEYARQAARKEFLLWPSILRINHELEQYCEKHRHMVYFDATSLFLGNAGDYQQQTQQINPGLMRDFVHPTEKGMELMGDAIVEELNRIIFEADEDSEIKLFP